MAIDSRPKRQGLVAVSIYPIGPNVTPNATKPQAWRQTAGYGYLGIVTAAPGGVTLLGPLVNGGLTNQPGLVDGGLVA